jgi:hypothetical protein
LLVTSVCFGQAKFTMENYRKFSAEFNTNPAEAITKNTTENYLYTNGVGNRYNRDELASNLRNMYATMLINTSNEKIQQLGTTAIVSGNLEQRDAFKQSPNSVRVFNGVFNYIYHFDGKAWKLASSQHSLSFPTKAEDEAAIKNVIIGETQAYIDGDGKKLLSFWADNKKSVENNSQFLVPILGQPYAKGESMQKLLDVVVPNLKKQDVTVAREDFEIRLNKDMAWATYTQKASANGTVFKTDREARILERINGEWKIVYVGEQVVK